MSQSLTLLMVNYNFRSLVYRPPVSMRTSKLIHWHKGTWPKLYINNIFMSVYLIYLIIVCVHWDHACWWYFKSICIHWLMDILIDESKSKCVKHWSMPNKFLLRLYISSLYFIKRFCLLLPTHSSNVHNPIFVTVSLRMPWQMFP